MPEAARERIRARLEALKSNPNTPPTDTSPDKPVQSATANVPVPSDSNLHIRSTVKLDEADPYYNFRLQLAEIELKLNDESPNFGILLRDIHKAMAEDPNVVTVLSPEEIGVIVKGLTATANTTIVATKTASSSRRRTQQLTVDDI